MKGTLAAIGTVILASAPLFGADGATPIWQQTIITQPGHYAVTRNLTGVSAVIRIEADDVDVDLNGFTLSNTGAGSVIRIDPSLRSVFIHDGNLVSSDLGIDIRPGGEVMELTVRNVSIRAGANPITGGEIARGVIENNTVVQTGTGAGVAVWIDCDGCRIVGNAVTALDGDGIRLWGSGNHVEGNVVRGCSGTGIDIGGTRTHLIGNIATDNGGEGLYLTGSDHVYRGNVARGNGGSSCGNPDFCDGATGNTSNGDNYLPTPM
jgi:parallel beta-helix repeat protein